LALSRQECQGQPTVWHSGHESAKGIFASFTHRRRFGRRGPAGIPTISGFPFDGSAIVMWDSGTPTPPTTNTPPRAGEDSHEHPRRTRAARDMKSAFLRVGGSVVNTCAPGPCLANGWTP
jgi:hypothetical protein